MKKRSSYIINIQSEKSVRSDNRWTLQYLESLSIIVQYCMEQVIAFERIR